MCGIYGLLSSRQTSSPPAEEFFQNLDRFIEETDPGALSLVLESESGVRHVVDLLESTRETGGRWMDRGALLGALSTPALEGRLRGAAGRARQCLERLEHLSETGRAPSQSQRETFNRLITGLKDIAWQVESDVLGNLPLIRELVEEPIAVALRRAYELNLVLRSLDRLEVRGRDSAGIAVYVRFESPAALDAFLAGSGEGGPRGEEVARRGDSRLVRGAVLRPPSAPSTLLFAFKVASEVGKMGDNVAELRRQIRDDGLFQALLREPEVEIQTLAHTRWASNGVISQANCHPVDSTVLEGGEPVSFSEGRFVAVLNGDIDNYRELLERYVHGCERELDPAITTDAKIIPVVIDHMYCETGDLEEAFRRAFVEFEGSMAIGLMAAERPREFFFGQKGSGQGLFFGVGGESVAVASEMYGIVELTSRYLKAEGESRPGGEIFRLRAEETAVRLELAGPQGFAAPADSRFALAEITTRDINRGDHPHFFHKEISESVQSVRNTLRGKFEVSEASHVRFLLGPDVLPVGLLAALREGRIRSIGVVGQGTAAVAAQGVSHLLDLALGSFRHPLRIFSEKAAEFSAYRLRPDMSDTLLIAVSQSGTTTDTNRTVDLARQRGAWVLAIVNRRNSDLVYKSHGVLYTSDGRDIEMSVASTKAFYAQNVAGQVLALGLAETLGTMREDALARAVAQLRALPEIMERTLAQGDGIAELARKYALRRRYWAVVGSGAAKIAADEIRIKLSELCYKSIAVDYLEDKKHIDLSSEPLVIVCAVGQPEECVSDAVKEVAIFKAHRAIPIVITEEGVDGFDPYASGSIKLPDYSGALSYLPATMAGHLFGYYAAASMDDVADRLRLLRGEIVRVREDLGFEEIAVPEFLQELRSRSLESVVELEELIVTGSLDGTMTTGPAVRLFRLLQLLLGRLSIDTFRSHDRGTERTGFVSSLLARLSEAISELSRPIDAIKHQAKTVTVGISRGETVSAGGVLWSPLLEAGVRGDDLLESHRILIGALEPLVAAVEGLTLYRVRGLDPLGAPTDETRIAVERKLGCSREMPSRCDVERPLAGNKWVAVKLRDVYLGRGQSDGRKVMILPVLGEGREGHIVLLHLSLSSAGDRDSRLRVLKARGRFFDRLKAAVTERNLDWDDSLIDSIDNDALLLCSPEDVAAELAHAHC